MNYVELPEEVRSYFERIHAAMGTIDLSWHPDGVGGPIIIEKPRTKLSRHINEVSIGEISLNLRENLLDERVVFFKHNYSPPLHCLLTREISINIGNEIIEYYQKGRTTKIIDVNGALPTLFPSRERIPRGTVVDDNDRKYKVENEGLIYVARLLRI